MKTKRVMSVKTLDVVEVPEDYIQCSICGSWEPPESYTEREDGKQTRTNCKSCYISPSDLWGELKKKRQEAERSEKYLSNKRFEQERIAYFSNSISVQEMVQALQKLPENARLYVGQEGHYANGKFADIFLPELQKTVDDTLYYQIGYSDQNY